MVEKKPPHVHLGARRFGVQPQPWFLPQSQDRHQVAQMPTVQVKLVFFGRCQRGLVD